MNDVMDKAVFQKITELQRKKRRLRYECDSIRDRIRDIEWRSDNMDQPEFSRLMDERQQAIDKLRHTTKELLDVELDLIAHGVEAP